MAVYVGLHWFNFDVGQFALVNMGLALVWLAVAVLLSREFRAREREAGLNLPPRLYRQLEDRLVAPGAPFLFELPADTFIDPDEGEVLGFTASLDNEQGLPDWLRFSPETLRFHGRAPADSGGIYGITLRATDFDGAWAEGRLRIRVA